MLSDRNTRCVLFLVVWFGLASTCVEAACTADAHHPENGGYYVEGIAGVINAERDTTTGRRADNTTWAPNTYYPHGEMKLCTGQFCSAEARTKGSAQYVVAHTCAHLRFSYSSASGSTVYEMPDLHAFETCDFSKAQKWGDTGDGDPHFNYLIEDDHEKKIYYFASMNGCASGQKVAVEVTDDYANNALQCANMGAGSSRIQHCDCNHQLKGTTLIDPCHTAFVNACKKDMPDDKSCCPDPSTVKYEGRKYVNGGTCVPKSKKAKMQQTVIDTVTLCETNATKCAEFEAMAKCPSAYNPAEYDPRCNQWKSIKKCESAQGSVKDDCATDLLWVMYQKHQSSNTPSTTEDATAVSQAASLVAQDKIALLFGIPLLACIQL